MSPIVVVRGQGRAILFIHGSATDHAAWTLQLRTLSHGFRVIAYDRRGAPSRPLRPDEAPSIADHAADAAAVVAEHAGGPALVVGSSFGGVIALELARRAPDRVAGLVLCEPPLSIDALSPTAPLGFGCALAERAARGGGEAAAGLFLRAVLGDAVVAEMPAHVRDRALATWPQIRVEARALAAWAASPGPREEFAGPVLLLGGDRSPPRFADGLDALELGLPRARRQTLPGAGHAMQVDQPRAFERAVRDFAATL